MLPSTFLSLLAFVPFVLSEPVQLHNTAVRAFHRRQIAEHKAGVNTARLAKRATRKVASGSLTTAQGCYKYHVVKRGDSCSKIASSNGLSASQLRSFNSGINSDCSNLKVGESYCTRRKANSINGSKTTSSKATKSTCTKRYTAKSGDTCSKIAKNNGISLNTFYQINSNVKSDCSNLYAGTSYCVKWGSGTTATTTKPASTTTTKPASKTTTKAASAPTKVADVSKVGSFLAQVGVRSFLGANTGSIFSWYQANSGQDSTNGNSWCYYPYSNDAPIFAPSLKTMLNNFGGDAMAARRAYCGLEAKVTTPDGKTATLYIGDAFDDYWVRTPTSIDIMHDAFVKLFGRWTMNKNDVMVNGKWEFTGKRSEQWTFNSYGSGKK